MAPRLQLHQLLETFAEHVYFQPPTNVQLQYPCIIYMRDFADTKFADDIPYTKTKRYMVTVIDPNPDSEIPDMVASLPKSIFNRFYTADNLNHDVYNVFF
jgi:hypothetical protein